MTGRRPARRTAARWRGALDVLGLLRRQPGITRADAARELGLRSGTATEIVARLRELSLIEERPVPPQGRGRPTTSLHPHPDGPVCVIVDIAHERWRIATAPIDGSVEVVAGARHGRRDAEAVLDVVRAELDAVRADLGPRARATSVVVSGTVQGHRLVQASTLEWSDVALDVLDGGVPERFVVDNDATLAGVAEARHRASAGSSNVLYLTIEVGIGGILVADGVPTRGATGAGGEFGHVPFGDPTRPCPCGARGCWDLEVDGRAMARHLGEAPPEDPRTYGATVIDRAADDERARRAVAECARSLGRGIGGLVNALDPDAVRLGGLAAPILRLAPDDVGAGYEQGLMAFRRPSPPPVTEAVTGDDGPLRGAAEIGLDLVVSEHGLEAWADALDAGAA
ncbi:MAG: ROK family transcriptional regulator [Actinomycetota bacterium]|nr:ROK family transcriptional regulator [Actinomycetota bacterium]